MTSIKLEDQVMRTKSSILKKDLNYLLSNINMNVSGKFGRYSSSLEAVDDTTKAVISFGSVYNSLASKLEDDRSKHDQNEDEFIRFYMAYVASEATKQILKNGNKTSLVKSISSSRLPANFKIEVTKTDRIALDDALDGLYKKALGAISSKRVKGEIKNYLELLSDYCVDKMNEPIRSGFLDNLKDVEVIGKGFKVEGIKKKKSIDERIDSKGQLDDSNEYLGLSEVSVDPVIREDIVGNESSKILIEKYIPCLTHYNPKEGLNFFKQGFKQYILFVGEPGTGKTMMARYAMTLAKEYSEKNNIPLSFVELNFEDKMQYGPVRNLRKQFKEIEEGNRSYIVFIDELDMKFPSRNNLGSNDAKADVVREFLAFRGGGEYINKGNYMVIGTSNNPSGIDPSIIDVFTIDEVPGPKDAKQRLEILQKNLQSGIDLGYVQVNDWDNISNKLEKNPLNGRGLFNIAESSLVKYMEIAKVTPMGTNVFSQEKNSFISNLLENDGKEYLTKDNDIINAVKYQVEKGEISQKIYI